MDKIKTGKNLIILILVAVVLTLAVLKVVPLKQVRNYSQQSLTASLQNPATATFAVTRGCFVIGEFSRGPESLANTISWYIFEPDGKTLVMSRNIDFQHDLEGRYSFTYFNFTAKVDGNYIFLVNATFLYASVPEAQHFVTMQLIVSESGTTTIL